MNTITADQVQPLFTAESAKTEVIPKLKEQIKAPVVGASLSSLGGPTRPTIMLTVSLDPKEKWSNGILQNSRYGNYSIDHDGVVEHFSGSLPKFRKRKFKSVDQFLTVFNAYLAAVPK